VFFYENTTKVLGSLTLSGPTGGAYKLQHEQNLHSRKKVIKTLHGRLVQVYKTLTDLQILGFELHKNAFGGRAPRVALPQIL